MNTFELSRNWFNYCFENPERIKPNHTAVYFFAIDHCNRLGWKDKFGFPSQMVMEAIGIRSWKTYSNTLNELVEFGFIKMIEKSRNQYSSNIIAIVKNAKATTKALDKALSNHSTKHSRPIVSIDKQYNKEQETNNTPSKDEEEFEYFWTLYDKKQDKKKCLVKWLKLNTTDKAKIFETVRKYVTANSDRRYRKNPLTYLNGENWNDIIEIKRVSLPIDDIKF